MGYPPETYQDKWAETRWESRIRSIEAVRYQTWQVKEGLLKMKETSADPAVRVEA